MSSTVFHCINCGRTWGSGSDVNSYGICIECLAEWALGKISCFGDTNNVDPNCEFHVYCKEYYEFKQSSSRRFTQYG